MKIDVLAGLQWGDEGKGKVVDVLASHYQVIARFQGGPNAGHSLQIGSISHVLHNIPSGIFHKDKTNIIGNGVVIDPVILTKEIEDVLKFGIDAKQNLLISKRANLILPTHKLVDMALEAAKAGKKIGSTLKGIGPAYTDKVARNGLRIGEIFSKDFNEKYNSLKQKHIEFLSLHSVSLNSDEEEKWMEAIAKLRNYQFIDSEYELNRNLKEGKRILAEGAQGTMLDIDFGTYPFVTSSNTISAGACTGLGVPPSSIGKVIGICKAYCTRVGSGPFPTELNDYTGTLLQDRGAEIGATTGRRRRCGWLDMVALKYAVMINGVTELIITKADVLDVFQEIKVATGYRINEDITVKYPFSADVEIEPVYKVFKGWQTDIRNIKTKDDLPIELLEYIHYIEQETEVAVTYLSTGKDRNDIIKF